MLYRYSINTFFFSAFFLVVHLLSGQELSVFGEQKFSKIPLLQEDFRDNQNNWLGYDVQNESGSATQDMSGNFVMTSPPGKSTFIVNQTVLEAADNFEISVSFQYLNPATAPNSPLSISWGVSFDTHAQYVVSMAPNGLFAYRMLSSEQEKEYLLKDIRTDMQVKKPNQLVIRKTNGSYHFRVNNQPIGQSVFEPLFGNGLILTCGSNLSLQLSNFTISRLVESENPVLPANSPPSLSVESPAALNGSDTYETDQKELTISGIASDEDGIRSLTVNGLSAPLANHRFNMQVPLILGRNLIRVIVTDQSGVQTIKQFEVVRQEPIENFIAGQKRLAVVIGNNDYKNAPPLRNPVNDAKAMGATLRELGFEVWEYHNLTYSDLIQAVRKYGDVINDYDVTLFFYAGHGMQVDEHNYLIPVDAVCDEKKDVQFEAIEVEKILRLMSAFDEESLHMMVLDACRNNPFRSWTRGGESGLASVQPPSGTLVAYATSPGSFAADGSGENGLYTSELIKQLGKSQRIEDVFINTRIEVEKKSRGQQSPWELARLRGKYYLK